MSSQISKNREEFKAKSGRLLLECEIWDIWRGAVVRIVKGGGRLGWGETAEMSNQASQGSQGTGLSVRITCLSALRRGKRGWLGAGRREGGLGWSLGGLWEGRSPLGGSGWERRASPPLED